MRHAAKFQISVAEWKMDDLAHAGQSHASRKMMAPIVCYSFPQYKIVENRQNPPTSLDRAKYYLNPGHVDLGFAHERRFAARHTIHRWGSRHQENFRRPTIAVGPFSTGRQNRVVLLPLDPLCRRHGHIPVWW